MNSEWVIPRQVSDKQIPSHSINVSINSERMRSTIDLHDVLVRVGRNTVLQKKALKVNCYISKGFEIFRTNSILRKIKNQKMLLQY